MKRKLFSKKDGTTFRQDINDISEDVRAFFNGLPAHIKKWLPEAEDIVRSLQKIENALQDGQPADQIARLIMAQIKGEVDEIVYEWLRDRLNELIMELESAILAAQGFIELETVVGETKIRWAGKCIKDLSDMTQIESDTTAQVAVYFVKS